MPCVKVVGFCNLDADLDFANSVVIAKKDIINKIPSFGDFVPLNVGTIMDDIRACLDMGKDVIVIASGDPMFFGIGEKIVKEFEDAVVIPNVSYMQLAFSRIKKSWKSASFVDLHALEPKYILPHLARCDKFLFAFTGGKSPLPSLFGFLKNNEVSGFKVYVFERLGMEDERVSYYSDIESLNEKAFSEPNCVIFERVGEKVYPFNDDLFVKKRGLLSKFMVRAYVRWFFEGLRTKEVFWDLGAGTGAIGITLCDLFDFIFGVENNIDNVDLIRINRKNMGAWNVIPVYKDAMAFIDSENQDPDGVFIGLGGSDLDVVFVKAFERLRDGGGICATAVSTYGVRALFDLYNRFKGSFKTELMELNTILYKDNNILGDRKSVWMLFVQKSM